MEKAQRNIQHQRNIAKNNNDEGEIYEYEENKNKILEKLNISSLKHNFNNFNITKDNKKAYDTMNGLCLNSDKMRFILLYGRTGCGKTHIIEATVIQLNSKGLLTRYKTFSDIARSLKTALRKSSEEYDRLFKMYCEVDRLIIDDIGMGTTESRFEISDLEDIIDNRYRKRYYSDRCMITIISSNKDVRELPDRIVSRFFDPEFGDVIYMGDKDYRRENRGNA